MFSVCIYFQISNQAVFYMEKYVCKYLYTGDCNTKHVRNSNGSPLFGFLMVFSFPMVFHFGHNVAILSKTIGKDNKMAAILFELNGFLNGRDHSFSYSGGLNTEHWNTKHIGILKFLNFRFPTVWIWNGQL